MGNTKWHCAPNVSCLLLNVACLRIETVACGCCRSTLLSWDSGTGWGRSRSDTGRNVVQLEVATDLVWNLGKYLLGKCRR